MAEYLLRRRALADLRRLWRESLDGWGRDHADRYYAEVLWVLDLIAEAPGIARLRREVEPPVRLHPHGAHVILYRDGPPVEVLRILHHRQDWLSRL